MSQKLLHKYLNLNNLDIKQMLTINEIEKTFKDLNIPINNNTGMFDTLSYYPQYIDRLPLRLNRKKLDTTIIAAQRLTKKRNTNC